MTCLARATSGLPRTAIWQLQMAAARAKRNTGKGDKIAGTGSALPAKADGPHRGGLLTANAEMVSDADRAVPTARAG